ncbi:MAG: MltA domain-containing protein [Deltaproteobacteria bacterium]|jgi:membrane-bound lytic murein transglycosylase A|nr:MltA domain-containing protein [Deltaproteobacteria bacterium]
MKFNFFKNYTPSIVFIFLFLLFITGCGIFKKRPPEIKDTALIRIDPPAYPDFFDDMAYDTLENGILGSISYLNRVSPKAEFRFGQDIFNTPHMIKSLEYFLDFIQRKPSKDELIQYIREYYLIYTTVGSDHPGQVFFTGYFEPVIRGSLNKDTEYQFPIYARPDDLTTIDLSLFYPQLEGKTIVGRYINQSVVPYYDRKEIEYEGLLEGKVQEIAWLKDRLDLFFLQIQGSGKIILNNGRILNVHYHGSNGHPYRSIGKLLIDEGKISREEISMQKIRDYLRRHPEEVETVLNHNPSYVFFKIEKDGPLGSLEVTLTPGRSIALDSRLFPPAGLAFIEAKKPLINEDGTIQNWTVFSRFVLNQDTGGAIRGPGRADLFWGNGPYAEIAAGHMQEFGTLYFLILKPDIP